MAELKKYIAEAFKNVHATLRLAHGSEQCTLSEVQAALQNNNNRISTKTDESLTEFDRVASFYSKGEDKRLESPSMYLSSKETRVASSLLLTNLVKACRIILLAISGS